MVTKVYDLDQLKALELAFEEMWMAQSRFNATKDHPDPAVGINEQTESHNNIIIEHNKASEELRGLLSRFEI